MVISRQTERTGIKQELVGYFAENEPIWVITDRLNEKQDIEDGLNRETVRIMNINDLLINAEQALRNNQPCASLVITQSLPIDIEKNLGEVVKALNLMPQVKIYEINRDPLFEYAVEMADIRQLTLLSRDKTRSANIKQFDNPDDKQADIMRSLEADLEIERKKLETEQKEKEEIANKLKEALHKLKALSIDVKHNLRPEVDKYRNQVEKLEEDVRTLNITIEQEKSKTKVYLNEKVQAVEEATNLEYDVKALNARLVEKDETIEKLKAKLARKEEEISELVLDNHRIRTSMVGAEIVQIAEQETTKKRKELDAANKRIDELRIENRKHQYTIKEQERHISQLRQGTDSVLTSGRTNLLDSQILTKTDLIYIKVIDNLPYHRLAIKMLFDMLNRNPKYASNGGGAMLIIKNDEGLDHVKFKNVELIGDLNGFPSDTNTVRLFPGASMFTGYESFENRFSFVLVIDYIQSHEYYLDTKARSHFMTMVQASHRVNDIDGLKGSPLSVDSDSIFNLNYSPEIANSHYVENRHEKLMNKVKIWYQKLNMIA